MVAQILTLPDDLLRDLTERWLGSVEDVGRFDTSMCSKMAQREDLFEGHRLPQPEQLTPGFISWINLKKSLCRVLSFGNGTSAAATNIELQVISALQNISFSQSATYFLGNVHRLTIMSHDIDYIVQCLELAACYCNTLTHIHVECSDTNFDLPAHLSPQYHHISRRLNKAMGDIIAHNCEKLVNVVIVLTEKLVWFDRESFDITILQCHNRELLVVKCSTQFDFRTVNPSSVRISMRGSFLIRLLERKTSELELAWRGKFQDKSERLCIDTEDEDTAYFYLRHHYAYITHTMVQASLLNHGRLDNPFDVSEYAKCIASHQVGSFYPFALDRDMGKPLTMTSVDCFNSKYLKIVRYLH